jgi:hypothetical protein
VRHTEPSTITRMLVTYMPKPAMANYYGGQLSLDGHSNVQHCGRTHACARVLVDIYAASSRHAACAQPVKPLLKTLADAKCSPVWPTTWMLYEPKTAMVCTLRNRAAAPKLDPPKH